MTDALFHALCKSFITTRALMEEKIVLTFMSEPE